MTNSSQNLGYPCNQPGFLHLLKTPKCLVILNYHEPPLSQFMPGSSNCWQVVYVVGFDGMSGGGGMDALVNSPTC